MAPSDVSTTVYRTVSGVDLTAHVFEPVEEGERPTVVFFHGGGLTTGSPDYFLPECEYLASRGMVSASVAYRLLPHQTRSVSDCVADAQAAIAWVRSIADVDPTRVAAVGYSAGGLLAGSTVFKDPLEVLEASCRPDALVLLNAVIDQTWLAPRPPVVHVPPTLLLHSRRDSMAPIGRARNFARAMAAAGHRCELAEFDGAHTFFRPYAQNGSVGFIGALRRLDAFLTELGFLDHDESAPRRIEAIGEAMLADVLARRAKRKRRPTPG